jgi:hypothetical protein
MPPCTPTDHLPLRVRKSTQHLPYVSSIRGVAGLRLGRTRRDLATVAPWTRSLQLSHSRVAQPPGRAPRRQLAPRTEWDRKDIFMMYVTTPVSLCFARWPRSSRLLGAAVGPGSHVSQCPAGPALSGTDGKVVRVSKHLTCKQRAHTIFIAPSEQYLDTLDDFNF